jgi:hypothetical protein
MAKESFAKQVSCRCNPKGGTAVKEKSNIATNTVAPTHFHQDVRETDGGPAILADDLVTAMASPILIRDPLIRALGVRSIEFRKYLGP